MSQNHRYPCEDRVDAQPVILVANKKIIKEMASEGAIFVEKPWNGPRRDNQPDPKEPLTGENFLTAFGQRMGEMLRSVRERLPKWLMGGRPELGDISMESFMILEHSYGTIKSILADMINIIAEDAKLQLQLKRELIDVQYDYKNKLSSYLMCFTDKNIGKLHYLEKLIQETMNKYLTCVHQIRSPITIDSLEVSDRQNDLEDENKCVCMMLFGTDPRECIGTRFVRNNMRFTLCDILARYDLDLITFEFDIEMDTFSAKSEHFVRVTKNPIKIF